MIRSNALRAGLVLLALLTGLLAASPMIVSGVVAAAALGLAGALALAGSRSQAPSPVPVRVRDRRR